MNRRTFLTSSAAAAGGFYVAACRSGEADAAADPLLPTVGLQLYTVRNLMAQDVPGTLRAVAGVGYREVEFAGYFDYPPGDIKSFLDEAGLSAPAAHAPLEMLRDDPEAVFEVARVIGHDYLVVPSLDPAMRETLDNYRQVASTMNAIGELCRNAGFQLAYHNHAFEFEAMDGLLPYDVLLDETDEDLVKLEIDLYWIAKGGQGALDYFGQYPGRFPLCHVKDMDPEGEMTDVGGGVIDFPEIFEQRSQAGLVHYFVEHDQAADPLQFIQGAYEYLGA